MDKVKSEDSQPDALRSKYHLLPKSGRRKQFRKTGGQKRWLRTRHRIKKRAVR